MHQRLQLQRGRRAERRQPPGAPAARLTRAATFLLLVAAAAAAQGAKKSFDIALSGGRAPRGYDTVRVQRGDEVELRWSSDRNIAVHLHGYDIEVRVTPGSAAVMAFRARIAGRFPVSEHGHGARHGRPLLYLEVHP